MHLTHDSSTALYSYGNYVCTSVSLQNQCFPSGDSWTYPWGGSIKYQEAYLLSSFSVSQFVLHLESSWCKLFPFSWFSSNKKPTEADLLCRWRCLWVKRRPNEITLHWTRTKASVVPKGNCWWEAEAHRTPKPQPLWVNAIFCIKKGAFCFSKTTSSVTLISYS